MQKGWRRTRPFSGTQPGCLPDHCYDVHNGREDNLTLCRPAPGAAGDSLHRALQRRAVPGDGLGRQTILAGTLGTCKRHRALFSNSRGARTDMPLSAVGRDDLPGTLHRRGRRPIAIPGREFRRPVDRSLRRFPHRLQRPRRGSHDVDADPSCRRAKPARTAWLSTTSLMLSAVPGSPFPWAC